MTDTVVRKIHPLNSLKIDPTGRWCFAGGRGRKIYLTDINTGLTESRDDHVSWVVTSARWGTSGVSVISPASELSPPPPPLPEPRAQNKPASSVGRIANPSHVAGTDGTQSMVVTGDLVGRLICWETLGERPDVRWSIETGHGTLRTVAISNDGNFVATGGGDGMLRLWSATDVSGYSFVPSTNSTVVSVSEITGHLPL